MYNKYTHTHTHTHTVPRVDVDGRAVVRERGGGLVLARVHVRQVVVDLGTPHVSDTCVYVCSMLHMRLSGLGLRVQR